MACFKKDQPADISYSNQLRSTLGAQSSLAPQQLGLEQQYQPQYAALALKNYQTISPGLTNQRLSNLDAARSSVPGLTDTVRSINPQSQALLGTLNAQVLGDLQAGTSLSPEQTRQAQQASRAAYAARGMSGDNAAIFDEGFQQYDLGRRLQQERQVAAGQTLNLNQSQVDSPVMQLLNSYLASANNPQETMALLDSAGPSLFNPESPTSSAITAGNQQMSALFKTSAAEQAGNAIAPLNSAVASY